MRRVSKFSSCNIMTNISCHAACSTCSRTGGHWWCHAQRASSELRLHVCAILCWKLPTKSCEGQLLSPIAGEEDLQELALKLDMLSGRETGQAFFEASTILDNALLMLCSRHASQVAKSQVNLFSFLEATDKVGMWPGTAWAWTPIFATTGHCNYCIYYRSM